MVNKKIDSNISDSKKLAISFEKKLFINKNIKYDYENIKEFSKTVLGDSYSEGKVSGTINKMINESKLSRVGRGKYMLSSPAEDINIKEIVNEKLTKALEEIQGELVKVDAVKLDDDNFQTFAKSRELLKLITEKLSDL